MGATITKSIIKKGHDIARDLRKGAPISKYRGKRLKVDRNYISVALSDRVRLIYHVVTKRYDITTHSQYDRAIGRGRL